jgi:hypothetical protein
LKSLASVNDDIGVGRFSRNEYPPALPMSQQQSRMKRVLPLLMGKPIFAFVR